MENSIRQQPHNRFELAIAFLNEANQAEKYTQQENPAGIRDFLKKYWFPACRQAGNFRIAERTLFCDFKNAFKIAEKYHRSASQLLNAVRTYFERN